MALGHPNLGLCTDYDPKNFPSFSWILASGPILTKHPNAYLGESWWAWRIRFVHGSPQWDPFFNLTGMVFWGDPPEGWWYFSIVGWIRSKPAFPRFGAWENINYMGKLLDYTSSTAQGGGGSFKNRKPIGDVGCCESRMAERIHWLTERWLELCLLEWLQWLQWSPHPQLLDVVWCTATVVVVVA